MVGMRRDEEGVMTRAETFLSGERNGTTDQMIAISRQVFDELSDEEINRLILRIEDEMRACDARGPMGCLMMFAGTYIYQEGRRRYCGKS